MRSLVMSVYDSKTDTFFPPFQVRNEATGVRLFEEQVRNPETQIHKFAADFTLFALGHFEDSDGSYELFDAPRSVISAYSIKSNIEKESN